MCGNIESDDLIHQHLSVGVVTQNGADGLSDVSGRKHRECNLIQQRLKRVMIFAVNNRDIDRGLAKGARRMDAGKTRSDDDNARDGCGSS